MNKTYTNTPEGKQVLEYLNHTISTTGMEVYKCGHCEELFGERWEYLEDEIPLCGICEPIIMKEQRDSHGLENAED